MHCIFFELYTGNEVALSHGSTCVYTRIPMSNSPSSSAVPEAPPSTKNALPTATNGASSTQVSSPHLRLKSFLDMLVIGVIAGGLVALYFRLNQVDARVFFLERRSSAASVAPRSHEGDKQSLERTCIVNKQDGKNTSEKKNASREPAQNVQEERTVHNSNHAETAAASDDDDDDDDDAGADEDVPRRENDTGSYLTPPPSLN